MEHKLSPTERLLINKKPLDRLPLAEALSVMVQSNNDVIEAVDLILNDIEKVILNIYKRLFNNNYGRLIYAGAGTSGRIGVQDGVELYPTFGWPLDRVDFLIAGGEKALTASVENAEDDVIASKKNVKALKINANDVVIGLAASGNTSFTNNVLEESRKVGALTIGISKYQFRINCWIYKIKSRDITKNLFKYHINFCNDQDE